MECAVCLPQNGGGVEEDWRFVCVCVWCGDENKWVG